jgi:hypothetical protein
LLRYTNLASLFDTLLHKRIFLLDPKSWEDTNDSYYLGVYKEKQNLKTLLALCLAETNETFHHWKVFSGNISGVCVEFDKEKLISHFKGIDTVIIDKVDYKKISELQSCPPELPKLPFYKRHPYRDEEELRIIYYSKEEEINSKSFAIDLSCIKQILLSYLLSDELRDSLIDVIHGLEGCERLTVIRTSLIDNKKWKEIADHMK